MVDTMLEKLRTGLAKYSVFTMMLMIAGQHPVAASAEHIEAADNLALAARSSQQQGVPTVVFVSREACPYCRTLRDELLLPMQRGDKFKDRAVLVEVNLDRIEPLTGFDDQPTTAQAFGDLYQAQITPTLLFLDPQGQEISKRIVGISNLELYGYYLQESIDTALEAIHAAAPGD